MADNIRRFNTLKDALDRDKGVPFTISYTFDIDFGAGDAGATIIPPAGRAGKIVSLDIVDVTETFTTDTTEARVDIGTAADANGYAISADFGALAAGTSLRPALTEGALGELVDGDTTIELDFIAPTGGTPAGIAKVVLSIAWI
jgi:hypothetical protein